MAAIRWSSDFCGALHSISPFSAAPYYSDSLWFFSVALRLFFRLYREQLGHLVLALSPVYPFDPKNLALPRSFIAYHSFFC